MNREALEDKIREWADFVINGSVLIDENKTPIIWGWGKGPRPKKQYISMSIISNPQKGQVYKSNVEISIVEGSEKGIQTLIFEYECTVSIQGYGDLMADKLDVLRISPEFIKVSEKLDSLDIVIRKTGDVTDISEVIDEQNEKRFLLEVVVGYAATAEDEPGWMTNVNYSGNYNPPA